MTDCEITIEIGGEVVATLPADDDALAICVNGRPVIGLDRFYVDNPDEGRPRYALRQPLVVGWWGPNGDHGGSREIDDAWRPLATLNPADLNVGPEGRGW